MIENENASSRCSCEGNARSEFGVVEDTEVVARVVCSPRHLGANGVKASLISRKDIESRGLSLTRIQYMSDGELKEFAGAVAGTIPGDTAAGYVEITASNLREMRDQDDEQALCLYDDPTEASKTIPANPAHAITVAAVPYDDAEILRIRTELRHKFSALMKFE